MKDLEKSLLEKEFEMAERLQQREREILQLNNEKKLPKMKTFFQNKTNLQTSHVDERVVSVNEKEQELEKKSEEVNEFFESLKKRKEEMDKKEKALDGLWKKFHFRVEDLFMKREKELRQQCRKQGFWTKFFQDKKKFFIAGLLELLMNSLFVLIFITYSCRWL